MGFCPLGGRECLMLDGVMGGQSTTHDPCLVKDWSYSGTAGWLKPRFPPHQGLTLEAVWLKTLPLISHFAGRSANGRWRTTKSTECTTVGTYLATSQDACYSYK